MSTKRDPAWERQLAQWRDWLDNALDNGQDHVELDKACKSIANALLRRTESGDAP